METSRGRPTRQWLENIKEWTGLNLIKVWRAEGSQRTMWNARGPWTMWKVGWHQGSLMASSAERNSGRWHHKQTPNHKDYARQMAAQGKSFFEWTRDSFWTSWIRVPALQLLVLSLTKWLLSIRYVLQKREVPETSTTSRTRGPLGWLCWKHGR